MGRLGELRPCLEKFEAFLRTGLADMIESGVIAVHRRDSFIGVHFPVVAPRGGVPGVDTQWLALFEYTAPQRMWRVWWADAQFAPLVQHIHAAFAQFKQANAVFTEDDGDPMSRVHYVDDMERWMEGLEVSAAGYPHCVMTIGQLDRLLTLSRKMINFVKEQQRRSDDNRKAMIFRMWREEEKKAPPTLSNLRLPPPLALMQATPLAIPTTPVPTHSPPPPSPVAPPPRPPQPSRPQPMDTKHVRPPIHPSTSLAPTVYTHLQQSNSIAAAVAAVMASSENKKSRGWQTKENKHKDVASSVAAVTASEAARTAAAVSAVMAAVHQSGTSTIIQEEGVADGSKGSDVAVAAAPWPSAFPSSRMAASTVKVGDWARKPR